MIDFVMLAEAAADTAPNMTTAVQNDVEVVPVDFIWLQITSLTWFQAVLSVSFGAVYLLYGWRIFKILTVICFGLIGMFAGIWFGEGMGGDMKLWGGFLGLLILASLSIPMLKWCICLLGLIAGGLLTGSIWYACELPQLYMWAGALVGAVAGGMISFIVFKVAVMLFTSMGGSAIMMTGALALLYLYDMHMNTPVPEGEVYVSWVQTLVFESRWFLPVALLIPTVIGLFTQNKLIRKSSEWKI